MGKDGEFILVVKCGCHCACTKENSDNGNQKPTSEYDVSFKQKSPTIILFCNMFIASRCFRSVETIYKNNKQIFRLQ